jgi:hypothetical protein
MRLIALLAAGACVAAEPPCAAECSPAGWAAAANLAPSGTRPAAEAPRRVRLTLGEPRIEVVGAEDALVVSAACPATAAYLVPGREPVVLFATGRRQWAFGGEPRPDRPLLPDSPAAGALRAERERAWAAAVPGLAGFLAAEARRAAVTAIATSLRSLPPAAPEEGP